MLRPFGKLVLTLGALALMASPAWAQGRGFGMGGGAAFLMAPNVQKDMKLSDAQVAKVQDTLQEVRERHQDDFADVRDASEDERPAKMRVLNKKISDEVKKALSLSDEQSKRYDQISIQARGIQAFSDPTVLEKVKLTDDQRSKIREIAESSRGAFGGANFKDASEEERAEMLRKFSATQRENMAKAQALLTADQKQAWKDLTGEQIEIQMVRRRPGN